MFDRRLDPAHALQGDRHVVVGILIQRFVPQRRLEPVDSVGPSSQLREANGEVVLGGDVLGQDLDGAAVVFGGGLEIARAAVGIAEIVMGIHVVGLYLERLLEMRDGLIHLAPFEMCCRQIGAVEGIIRFAFDGVGDHSHRIIEPPPL